MCLFSSGKQQQQQQQAGNQHQEKEGDGAAIVPVAQGQAEPAGERPDRVWHYDEEFLSGGGSPKPASCGSAEQGEGAVISGGFVALNLSSGRQDVDSREWVMVERPSGSPGAKVTTSPSEEDEEPEVLQLGDQSPGWERGYPGPNSGNAKQGSVASSKGSAKVDKLELSVGLVGALPPVTPTSPAEALAEGVLTQVSPLSLKAVSQHGRHDTDRSQHFTKLKFHRLLDVFWLICLCLL